MPPENDSARIWRYLDFTKLVSLFESQSLFFARTDKLGDPFEGSWPQKNLRVVRDNLPDIPVDKHEIYFMDVANISNLLKKWAECNAISCWHLNEQESAAMWRLYLKSDEGIAIQSTFARLRDSITDDRTVYIGTVRYIDYETDWFDPINLYEALLHKRKSFEHERELRAVVTAISTGPEEREIDFSKSEITDGIKIAVNVNMLIENIYVAPDAPTWFTDLVSSIVNRYKYKFNVQQSKLSERPIY
ncbi:MAG: hypothetical protein AAF702_37685 [Chloroflexota bacterium]